MAPARTLREAYQATDTQPLLSGDPYFVDLSAARHSWATDHLKRMIENCAVGRHAAIAFTGHRGSGKSTELHQLRHVLSHSCFTLHLDVNDFLDASDVDYTDLFLLLSRRLLEELSDSGIGLSVDLLKGVENWFRSVTNETEESLKLSAGVSVEGQAGIQIPFLAKLLAKLTADVKAGSSHKKTTREEMDHYFSGLLANTNTLLTASSEALKKAGKPSQILVLLDNLDRMDPERSEKLFFAHGSQLQGLECHAVYTVSIETFYSHSGLGNVFPKHVLLPNIKLQQSKIDPTLYQPGMDGMIDVIGRRLAADVLLHTLELRKNYVMLSGGSVRQMIRLLQESVLSAQSRRIRVIDAEALKDAAQSLQQDFQRSLEEDDYKLLAQTEQTKSIKKDEAHMRLLRNTAIMEYNGSEVWYNVNPLIQPIDAFQAAKK
jgi:energy-coupling factor transporter ATP-binding protein EcfA2